MSIHATAATWTTNAPMTLSRLYHTTTLLTDGKVLVAGGIGVSSTELYDPQTGSWSPAGPLGMTRYEHSTTLLPNGKVLVVGGVSNTTILASAEIFDPVTGTWSYTGSLSTARRAHTAPLLMNGNVLTTGAVQFSFTNAIGAPLTVSATTNLFRRGSVRECASPLALRYRSSRDEVDLNLSDDMIGAWVTESVLGGSAIFSPARCVGGFRIPARLSNLSLRKA